MMACSLELLAINIHQDDVLLLVGEHSCQVSSYFSCACYDYSHDVQLCFYFAI